jgi:hypothetical protein
MSKRLHYILSTGACAAAIAAAVATSSSAQEAAPPKGGATKTTTMERPTTTPAKNLRTVTLTVKDVDRDEHKITFEAHVKPEANISSNGRPIALDQLQKGETLRVTMDPATGEVIKAEVTRKMGTMEEK